MLNRNNLSFSILEKFICDSSFIHVFHFRQMKIFFHNLFFTRVIHHRNDYSIVENMKIRIKLNNNMTWKTNCEMIWKNDQRNFLNDWYIKIIQLICSKIKHFFFLYDIITQYNVFYVFSIFLLIWNSYCTKNFFIYFVSLKFIDFFSSKIENDISFFLNRFEKNLYIIYLIFFQRFSCLKSILNKRFFSFLFFNNLKSFENYIQNCRIDNIIFVIIIQKNWRKNWNKILFYIAKNKTIDTIKKKWWKFFCVFYITIK